MRRVKEGPTPPAAGVTELEACWSPHLPVVSGQTWVGRTPGLVPPSLAESDPVALTLKVFSLSFLELIISFLKIPGSAS